MPDKVEIDTITFRASERPLLLEDLTELCQAVALIYNAKLSVSLYYLRRQDQIKTFLSNMRGEKLPFKLDPELLAQLTRDESLAYKLHRLRIAPFYPLDDNYPDATEISRNLHLYSPPSNRCFLYSAVTASPVKLSFAGVADVMKEFREFVKDLWYRNRQEAQEGDLENRMRRLQVERAEADFANEYLLPAYAKELGESASPKLIEDVGKGITKIEELQDQGKILSVPEHIEEQPDKRMK